MWVVWVVWVVSAVGVVWVASKAVVLVVLVGVVVVVVDWGWVRAGCLSRLTAVTVFWSSRLRVNGWAVAPCSLKN